MRYKLWMLAERIPLTWRVVLLAALWLAVVSGLHYRLNIDHGSRPTLSMGYMPVITNLAAPLIDYASRSQGPLRFKALKFASFAEMAEALRNDRIQAAFMIAPLAVVLRQQQEDVKIVYIGNRHESTLVVRKELPVNTLRDLAGRTVAVPMRYSGHNLSILQIMETHDVVPEINVVEMNPPDMASALISGALDAYYVGEPFAAQTLQSGNARLLTYVEDVWRHFICNLVLVKADLIAERPQDVMRLVQAAVRSGFWARQHQREAAQIAARYWNQSPDLITYALTTPPDRILFDRFVPVGEEIQHMADRMVRYGLIADNDIEGLVEDRFARAADISAVTDLASILSAPVQVPSLVARQ